MLLLSLGTDMRRREFFGVLGGAAAAWPLSARAQQGERMRRIGVLSNIAEDYPQMKARFGAFRQGLERAATSASTRDLVVAQSRSRRMRMSFSLCNPT